MVIILNENGISYEQNVLLENRKKLTVNGIVSVDSFDEVSIVATTQNGARFVVEGENIAVSDVNLENGRLIATGIISGFFYEEEKVLKKSLLSRIFNRE